MKYGSAQRLGFSSSERNLPYSSPSNAACSRWLPVKTDNRSGSVSIVLFPAMDPDFPKVACPSPAQGILGVPAALPSSPYVSPSPPFALLLNDATAPSHSPTRVWNAPQTLSENYSNLPKISPHQEFPTDSAEIWHGHSLHPAQQSGIVLGAPCDKNFEKLQKTTKKFCVIQKFLVLFFKFLRRAIRKFHIANLALSG